MSSIDFDEVLLHVGEKGRYQNIMYYLLCIPATLPAAFLAFSQVFVSASPEHWCRIPELDNITGVLMSLEDRKALSLPYRNKSDGKREYSKCLMYDTNYTALLESWLSSGGPYYYDNATSTTSRPGDVADTGGFNDLRQDGSAGAFNDESYGSTVNPTSLLRFPRRLPPPPVSDPNWPIVQCKHGWNYDTRDYDSTLVTELDLVCDNSWWPSTSTTFFFVGSLFGNVVFGWIADKWGRRTAFLTIIFPEVIFSIATSFSPNYVVYTALRTINGLFFPAIYQIPFILALELMGPRYRTFAGMVISIFFATAMSLLALLSYLMRNWYSLSLVISVPFVALFSYYWIIPESPRWLLSKNRIDEAEVIVQAMAKSNGKAVPPNFLRTMELEIMRRQGVSCNDQNSGEITSADLATENRVQPISATPMDLLTNPNIRKKFFILAFDWVANAVVYNGLSYNTTNLGVSDYLAFFIGGVVEIPSYIVTWYAMDRLGRRWVLCITMLLGGVACVSCMFVPEDNVWLTVCLAMVGKFGIAASFAVFYVFVGELLPTVLRSQAMGIASFIAGIGLLTFPYIVHLAVYWRVLPLIVMGSLSVAGAVTSIFLPETLNIHLPQTIEEGELFGADFKLWSCPTSLTKSKKRKGSERIPLKHLVNGGPDRRTSASPSVDPADPSVSAIPTAATAASSNNSSRTSLERQCCLSRSSSGDEENLTRPVVPKVERRRAVVLEGPERVTLVTVHTDK
ncbi:beta-alanine transporter [Nasonia vitripennis]|uniref:Major facilitator superfamily (MFS) profile domain-containing protein n=1 Tax=Nasonia vitripennis TaxID=7425 RepID=A0A7M7T9V7_NASVI|nr:beta-alanine transporter [Nasonia vitripennis]XP_008211371.1 beta-alanine transporter [Nasonia vitripennis]XP_008211372.1 beta-alanine transporter [Nasonia vitripennis]XP_031785667.1 beta-alanine transporter [Nasonia vitripennis]